MPRPFLLSQLIERAAAEDPAHLAFSCEGETLDYGELVDQAARFAQLLGRHGIGRGDLVALHLSKSTRAVAALYGTLWAGAAHVPIDPFAPDAAVRAILDEAKPSALVVDEARVPRSIPDGGLALLTVADHGPVGFDGWDDVQQLEPAPPAAGLGDDPAYVIFTSGSTGRPKGILHSHRSALRYAELAAETYALTASDRLANIAPFHFDQSTFELYAGPVARATTVLVPSPILRFPAEVANLIERDRPSVWYSVPTVLVDLLERGGLEGRDLESLRWILFGGEVFPSTKLAQLMDRLPGARFSNVYGPAEVNQCTFHHLDATPAPNESIPIGLPWGDTEVMLVDEFGETVESTGSGELWVRTATMMLHYLGAPERTSARVVERRVGTTVGRWYCTGDVVERDSRGLLHFVGRVDRQVKIRGTRVELEGVERALCDIGPVTHAAVTLSDTELVALVQVEVVDQALAPAELRRQLATRLPRSAVPDRIIVVDALPRTASGKIDPSAAAALIEAPSNEELNV